MARVLAIDDDPSYLESMTDYLRLKGHEAAGVTSPPEPGAITGTYDIVLLDIALDGESGFDWLERYAAAGVPTAMVSGLADARTAVRAVKAGAVDVLEKPVEPERLEVVIAMAEEKAALARSDRAGRDAWLAEHLYVGGSEAMRSLVEAAERGAATSLCVLLHGPSGSGKDPLARWIHFRSRRSAGPFVAVNCASIPADLAESELFGHRRGSFTGADRDRAGCFAEAAGGTLFLDEVGELPPALQPKLLRAIESGEFRPLGADSPRRSDARIVAATNRDLKAEAAKGAFREDLLYRLAQIPLAVPPISARVDDIPALARFFAGRLGGRGFSDDALEYLGRRDYPGNVRELRNLVERALALAPEAAEVDASAVRAVDETGWKPAKVGQNGEGGRAFPLDQVLPLKEAKRRMELAYIERQVELAGGSVSRAAERLDVLPNNLSRRIGELRETDSRAD